MIIGLLAAVAVALGAWAVWATWIDEESRVSGPDVGVTAQEISTNPSEYAGSRVVISGEIDQVIAGGEEAGVGAEDGADIGTAITPDAGAGAFTLGADASVLVVGSNIPGIAALSANEDLAQGDLVQVAGTVRTYDETLLQEELGGAFNEEDFAEFGENQAILVADTLRLVPQGGQQQGEQVNVTMSALVDRPQEFFGETVTVTNATIGEELGGGDDADAGGAFESADDSSVLILAPQGVAAGLTTGTVGTLTGTVVEPSTVALVRELGLANESDLFAAFGLDEGFDIQQYQAVLVLNPPVGQTPQGG